MRKINVTPQELCERLFNGESFYDGKGDRLFWDGSRFMEQLKPNGFINGASLNSWITIDIYTKPHWTDNLSVENPVYCWVWNNMREDATKYDVCGIYKDGTYRSTYAKWRNAEPVKLEDACIWSDKI